MKIIQKWRFLFLTLIIQLSVFSNIILAAGRIDNETLTYQQGALIFTWNMKQDSATVKNVSTDSSIWHGCLLPSFWLEVNNRKLFVKTTVMKVIVNPNITLKQNEGGGSYHKVWELELQVGSLGKGYLDISKEPWGIRFSKFVVEWYNQVPAIIEMYFGVSGKTIMNSLVWPTWDRPFMPTWKSSLFCVPGAREGLPQSYFRSWDFGQANIALGDFGPSMGSPYGAAYPRPLYFAGMGSDDGFIALGAGSIPDAAMSLRIQSTRGCFQYVYDENIWGALSEKRRIWKEPLRITIGKNAWMAFKRYYNSFPNRKVRSNLVSGPIWNTWGVWKNKKYLIRPIVDFAKKLGAGYLCLDDGWESSAGSSAINLKRFPNFFQDITYAKERGIKIGLWESVGWIADPFSNGLSKKDLILDRRGDPCKASWDFDPSEPSFYCLDISSERVRKFIKQRTINIMQTINPAILKLDFMYGLPSPSMGLPRDPKYRGERYGYALFHLIATTAKTVNPNVIIEGYSISPLWSNDIDVVSMDDQGDLWYDETQGHQQWSVWGTLLSNRNIWVSGSSGYRWSKDDEAVLNSCILGLPGAVLSIYSQNGKTIPKKYINRRLAIDHWYRRTRNWTPLWLNSQLGGYKGPIQLNCWGRLERRNGKDSVLMALVLRKGNILYKKVDIKTSELWGLGGSITAWKPALSQLKWVGRWALISQDNKDIFSTSALALIPFDPGEIFIPYLKKPYRIIRLSQSGKKDFKQWKWKNGRLTIKVSDSLLNITAGFLVYSKK